MPAQCVSAGPGARSALRRLRTVRRTPSGKGCSGGNATIPRHMPLLSAAILGFMLVSGAQTDARQSADRLARAGHHADALRQFQSLAAASPDDVEARMWIARLHTWMGNHGRGLEVYRSIVATNPQHVEALIG